MASAPMHETRTRDQRTEDAAREAETNAREIIGAVLTRTFPEATTGDESPTAVSDLSDAIAYTVREWVRNNVPDLEYVRIGRTGPIALCAICGYPVIVNNEVTGERACLTISSALPIDAHDPAPAFYPGRVTVRDLIKSLQAEPNLDVPVLIATDDWYKYVGEYHRGPTDDEAANGGHDYVFPTIEDGDEYDATDA